MAQHTGSSGAIPKRSSQREESSGDDVIKEGWLDVRYKRKDGKRRWPQKGRKRFCVVVRRGTECSLVIYQQDKTTIENEVNLTQLRNAAMKRASRLLWGRAKRCKLLTMDGVTWCVISAAGDIIADWLVFLNRAIMAARCHTGETDSACEPQEATAIVSGDAAETEFLNAWFPELDTHCYIVPPAHMEMQPVFNRRGGYYVVEEQQDTESDAGIEDRDTGIEDNDDREDSDDRDTDTDTRKDQSTDREDRNTDRDDSDDRDTDTDTRKDQSTDREDRNTDRDDSDDRDTDVETRKDSNNRDTDTQDRDTDRQDIYDSDTDREDSYSRDTDRQDSYTRDTKTEDRDTDRDTDTETRKDCYNRDTDRQDSYNRETDREDSDTDREDSFDMDTSTETRDRFYEPRRPPKWIQDKLRFEQMNRTRIMRDLENDTHTKTEQAGRKLHNCLNKIKENAASQGEVMVIMTQGKCGLFAAGSRSLFTGAARKTTSETAVELDSHPDFVDLVVIHRDHGVVMGTILNETREDHGSLEGDVRQAVEYLEQAETVVREKVVHDLLPRPAVRPTLLLPRVTRQCLQQALCGMTQVKERLERCLGVDPQRDVSQYVLCEDDIADKTKLSAWWATCLETRDGQETSLAPGVYRTIVARFTVALTTVEISLSSKPRLQLWAAGHGVEGDNHARNLTRIALFPRQQNPLEDTPYTENDDDIRFLLGGPGTGKTVMLVLRGVGWAKAGCDTVYCLQTAVVFWGLGKSDGAAAAYMLTRQLRQTVARPGFTVTLVPMVLQEAFGPDRAQIWTKDSRQRVESWCDHVANSEGRRVHILADEAHSDVIRYVLRELKKRQCTVKLWAAGVRLRRQLEFEHYKLEVTTPLRSPPTVVQEVEQVKDMMVGTVLPAPYIKSPVAQVITISHYREADRGNKAGHQAEGRYDSPIQCEECGRRVGHTLINTLNVGQHDTPRDQGGLRYNDVFILGYTFIFKPRKPFHQYDSPGPFMRGLQQMGIPSRVVDRNDMDAIRRIAENSWVQSSPGAAQPPAGVDDAVTVVEGTTVKGLERKIVVCLDKGGRLGRVADRRLEGMSRCMSHFVWVRPEPYSTV